MKLSENVKALADEMAGRQGSGGGCPYILFIGRDCARKAGVPTFAEMARRLFNQKFLDKWLPLFYLELRTKEPADDELVEFFLKLLGHLPSVVRHITLQNFYRRIPVPLFYQDIAMLIKAGFFKTIMTTNIDTLLEEALLMAGMRVEVDYRVVNIGDPDGRDAARDEEARGDDTDGADCDTAPVTIFKLLGDIGQPDANLNPDDIDKALRSRGKMMKHELEGDLIMAGYEFECDLVERWLTKAKGRQLWWVNPAEPAGDGWPPIELAREVSRVEGANADYEQFFALLNLLLRRLPVLATLNASVEDYISSQGAAAPSYEQLVAAPLQLDETELEVECLRDQMKRCRDVLYKLEQMSVAGEQSLSLWLQCQIDYQRRRNAELEDALRQITAYKQRVLHLMSEIMEAARARQAESDSTIDFLQSQLNVVGVELAKPEPNHYVVSAAISATLSLAERLGSEVVEAGAVRELASLASGAAAKGV
jgi:hypothetical protein